MRTTRPALCAASILLASVLLFSCNNDYGVFSSVQKEKAQNGNSVFQETPVYNAFRLGANYYAATATLNTRSVVNAAGWKRVGIGSGAYTLRGAVLVGSATTGTIYALVEASSSIVLYQSSDGSNWTALPNALPAQTLKGSSAFTFDALYSANGKLYAESHGPYDATPYIGSTGAFNLWLFNPIAQTFSTMHGNFAPALPVVGVVYDSANYWFASGDLLYSGPNADASLSTSVSSTYAGLSSKTIWGLSFAGANVYIATQDGSLYQSGSSGGYLINSSVPATQVVQVPATTGNSLLVGTDANAPGVVSGVGYYEGGYGAMAIGSVGAVTGNSAIYNTTVSASPVHNFFYDPVYDGTGNSILFICVSPGTMSTTYYGLYSSVWNGSSWAGWSAE
jgi:hypothetical protein